MAKVFRGVHRARRVRLAPSSRYAGGNRAAVGGRVGERGERLGELIERGSDDASEQSAASSSPGAPSPSPLPFHQPLRGYLRSTGKRELIKRGMARPSPVCRF